MSCRAASGCHAPGVADSETRGSVVAVENGLSRERMESLAERRSPQQIDSMIGAVALMDFEAHDLAAVNIKDHVQIEPLAQHSAGEERYIPAPQLPRPRATCVLGGRLR